MGGDSLHVYVVAREGVHGGVELHSYEYERVADLVLGRGVFAPEAEDVLELFGQAEEGGDRRGDV